MATAEETEKKVEQETENNDEEEAMEESKGHKALFDQPLIQEGKRKRKSTDVFSYSGAGKVRKDSVGDGSGGSGIKLKESPFIDYQISKHKPDDLKPLHKLCFERPGTKAEIRRNLRFFNGWDFSKETEIYKKKISYLEKLETSVLELCCKVLDVEPSKEPENMVESLAEFLMCPKDSGRSVPPSPVKRRKSSSGRPAKKSKTSESDEEEPREEEGTEEKPNGEVNNDDAMETGTKEEEESEAKQDDDDGEKEEEKKQEEMEEEKQEADLKPSEDEPPSSDVQNSNDSTEQKPEEAAKVTSDGDDPPKQEIEA